MSFGVAPWLLGPPQAPDLLIELDAIALLGRLAAFLAANLADLAEMVFSIAFLGRPSALSTSLSSAHLAYLHFFHLGLHFAIGGVHGQSAVALALPTRPLTA